MKRRLFLILIVALVAVAGIFVFLKSTGNEVEPVGSIGEENQLSEDEIEKQLQVKFQSEGLGFLVEMFPLKGSGYLVLAKQRGITYEKDYPGDQLIWVSSKDSEIELEVLSKGDHKIHLVMNDESDPYYLSGSDFLFSFYQGKEINGVTYKGKGYVYEAKPKGKLEKSLETKGDFYDFGFDKEGKMMFIEKVESDERNQYPSYFAPYMLHYKEWKNGKWKDVKQQEIMPNINKESEKMKEAAKEK